MTSMTVKTTILPVPHLLYHVFDVRFGRFLAHWRPGELGFPLLTAQANNLTFVLHHAARVKTQTRNTPDFLLEMGLVGHPR
jgi:hypothetical protein